MLALSQTWAKLGMSKALKPGFFIFCIRNKVKTTVLVVRNTSVEISGQQCRFSKHKANHLKLTL